MFFVVKRIGFNFVAAKTLAEPLQLFFRKSPTQVAWKRASSLSHSGNRNCEIAAKSLKQRTILFKLIDIRNRFPSVGRKIISLKRSKLCWSKARQTGY